MPKRIVIVGGPSVGKTTLARQLAAKYGIREVRQTDHLIGMDWSEVSAEASKWIDEPGEWIIEGTAGARALRKWLNNNPDKPLPDGTQIVMLNQPYIPQTKNQRIMSAGILTVLTEIYGQLIARGATFERPDTV